ncbi:MAG: ArsR/SmtB family transcription factor [Sciscionella sp.]
MHVATALDPMWETILGIQQLSVSRRGTPVFSAWRRRACAELAERELNAPARLLHALAPEGAGYFPDFLTPAAAANGLAAGLEALRATPRRQLGDELRQLSRMRRLPRGTRGLAVGDGGCLAELADAFRLLHNAVIAPDWTEAAAAIESDRAVRARAVRDGGVPRLLDSFRPTMRWQPPVLYANYPEDRDIHLGGRGLRLIPSYFCWQAPVALADPTLPQVMVYPVEHTPALAATITRDRHPKALAAILGHTRARVLAALDDAATTGEIARRLRTSAASASEHVSVLRNACLTESQRSGSHTVHTLTPLGAALLQGQLPPNRVGADDFGQSRNASPPCVGTATLKA